jgi:hypothetical protein
MQLKLLTLAATAALATTAATSAATVAYDGFATPGDYTAGADINGINGGTNWATGWSGNPNVQQIDATASGLSYSNLVTADGAAFRSNPNGFAFVGRDFAASNQDGVIYFSYLLQNANDTNENDRIAFSDTSGDERFRIGSNNNEQITIGTKLAGGDDEFYVLDTSGTVDFSQGVLIVGEINVTAGGNDSFSVWINPIDLSDVAGSAQFTLAADEQDARDAQPTSSVGSFAPINGFDIRATARSYTYDEIRVSFGSGAGLDDVVPVPEPTSLVGAAIGGLMLLGRRRRG